MSQRFQIIAVFMLIFLVGAGCSQDTSRTLIKRSEIAQYKAELPEPCEFEKIDALHFNDEETAWATYRNPEKGLEISIPYNPEWGAPEYRLNPYDESPDGLSFGRINVRGEGCGAWTVTRSIRFLPAETKTAVIAGLKKKFPDVTLEDGTVDQLIIQERKILDKEIIEYYAADGMGGPSGTIVIGRKYNYGFFDNFGSPNDPIETIRFIE